jgi:hypothetical protein
MDSNTEKYYRKLKKAGLTPEQDEKIRAEMAFEGSHEPVADGSGVSDSVRSLYNWVDAEVLQNLHPPIPNYTTCLQSIDELLERDRQREKDGFPRKIRVGRLVKPGKGGKDKVVVVPTTVEEKFIHDNRIQEQEEGESSGGSGDGEEGEVIGEQPVRAPDGSGAVQVKDRADLTKWNRAPMIWAKSSRSNLNSPISKTRAKSAPSPVTPMT